MMVLETDNKFIFESIVLELIPRTPILESIIEFEIVNKEVNGLCNVPLMVTSFELIILSDITLRSLFNDLLKHSITYNNILKFTLY